MKQVLKIIGGFLIGILMGLVVAGGGGVLVSVVLCLG